MAKLSISDAARVAGVSRVTLHRYMKAGKLSRTPDGSIDTTELVRAGFVLHLETLPDDTPVTPVQQYVTSPAVTPPVAAETHAAERMIELLQQQVDDLRAHVHRYEERERDYRAHITWLQQHVEQSQHRYDRLLEAPRPAPTVGIEAAPGVSQQRPPSPTAAEDVDRGTIRRRILALLQDHPEGLSTIEIRIVLGMKRSLTDTCTGMLRDGLLQRVSRGRYRVRTA